MKEIYRLFVQGRPAAQPRTRKGMYGNIYNPKTADAWKETIQVNFLAKGLKEIVSGPVCLEINFYFYGPKAKKKEPHIIKQDGDNLLKAVMDALKNIGVYKDDCQVYLKTVGKYWTNDRASEGMFIRVSEVV